MHVERVQTKRQIQELLGAAGLRPRKRYGQHFLIDGNLMRRLAAAAELTPNDVVLEVGGGTGGLTDLLLGRVAHVVCVEIDPYLNAVLGDRFREPIRSGQLTLVGGDVLASKHHLSSPVVEAIRAGLGAKGQSYAPTARCAKLVANLPFSVATPLVMNLLVDYPEVRRLVFTVQAEVGQRIAAGPGTKAYGPLSILTQGLCRTETIARVPCQAFWPRPAVDSVMMRLDVLPTGPTSSLDSLEQRWALLSPLLSDREALRRFASFVRATFDHRRKTLRAALGYVLDRRQRDRICRRFDCARRPEALSLQEWPAIFEMLGDES